MFPAERQTMNENKVKIRISYEREEDAKKVLEMLKPIITGAKIRRSGNGRYKKLYIEFRGA